MKILISGGGIGGLTTALCLAHQGFKAIVLERADELGEVGAGIQIPPNAMKVFKALGLDAALEDAGFRPAAIEARMGKTGRQLFRAEMFETSAERWGAPYLHIHRADYITVLAAALEARAPGSVKLGADVTDYTQSPGGVHLLLSGNREIDGDLLIGADGIHSVIRRQMLGAQEPRFTGNVAWRAVVPIEHLGELAPRPTACIWMGAGKHCVTYRLRGGALANLVGVVERDDWTTESWTERGSPQEALEDFRGWHPVIKRILQETKSLYRWALFDRAPLKTWVNGRVALLGDAAHPMLPFMAQGAAMAVEDAWVLAQAMAQHTAPEPALRAYEAARLARASKVQAGSRANAATFHKRTLSGQLAAYGPMWLAGTFAPGVIHQRQDWLFGHDVTAETYAL